MGATINVNLSTSFASTNAPAISVPPSTKTLCKSRVFNSSKTALQISRIHPHNFNARIYSTVQSFLHRPEFETNNRRRFLRGRHQMSNQAEFADDYPKQSRTNFRRRAFPLLSVKLGLSTNAVLPPTKIASCSCRKFCTFAADSLPESVVETEFSSEILSVQTHRQFQMNKRTIFLMPDAEFFVQFRRFVFQNSGDNFDAVFT